jgi:hypothetical protein
MGNSIFNTLLVKGKNADQLAKIKSSIIDINNEGNTEIVLSKLVPIPPELELQDDQIKWCEENWSIRYDRWDANFEVAEDYVIIQFWTINTTPWYWVENISKQFPEEFFLITRSSVYDGNCHTLMGRNGAMYEVGVPVFDLDNNRQPIYYDSIGDARYFNSNEVVPKDLLGGRAFRNPFTLLIDVLLKGNPDVNF